MSPAALQDEPVYRTRRTTFSAKVETQKLLKMLKIDKLPTPQKADKKTDAEKKTEKKADKEVEIQRAVIVRGSGVFVHAAVESVSIV